MPIVTQAAYARLRGVSKVAVHHAVREGRITPRPDGKLDSAVADREWAENSVRGSAAAAADVQPEAARRGVGTFTEFRTAKASYDAKMAKLEYEKAAGLVLSAAEVESKWVEICVAIRTAIEGIPASCSERVHAARDIREAHTILADECRAVLKRLAADVAGLAGGVLAKERTA